MYQFKGSLKIAAIILMVAGALLTGLSFSNAPKTLEEAKAILAKQHDAHGAHGDNHEDSEHVKPVETHSKEISHTKEEIAHEKEKVAHKQKDTAKTGVIDTDTNETEEDELEMVAKFNEDKVTKAKAEVNGEFKSYEANKKEEHHNDSTTSAHGDSHHDDHHAEHVFHQMQNKPVAAFYVAMLFFLGISLLVMAFYAAQRVAHAGWSVVLFRVFEAITNNIHYVSIFMLLFIIGTAIHKFHLFPWMAEGTFDPKSENYDAVVDAKKWWMNVPGWIIRSIIYLGLWNGLRFIIRKKSIKQDNGDVALHKNIYNWCVGFIVVFMVTESMMSWDWIMGIDPHWFSTLFGWYVLATFLVCALTIVALITIYLRSKGYLPLVNDSHIHDLAKFMFGFSVFWTYLWFAQFMLIWYADMPEETTYFAQRFNEYKVPFLAMVVMNFVFPVLILLNSDFKSIPWFVVLAGIVILVGHYIDLFVMIMPGTVGGQWSFGVGEIGGLLFFAGLFIWAVFSAFAKANPIAKGNPFLHESETFHYYNIQHRGEDENSHH